MIEKKLKNLFEYQKFERNGRLDKLIAETDARQAAALSDDALEFVAAAGEISHNSGAEGSGVFTMPDPD